MQLWSVVAVAVADAAVARYEDGDYGGDEDDGDAMSAARVVRNFSSDERDGAPLAASDVRKQGVVDRMVSSSSPPVAYWSERHLEKMIKTNSAFRDRAEEFRSAHAKASVRDKLAEVPNSLMGA